MTNWNDGHRARGRDIMQAAREILIEAGWPGNTEIRDIPESVWDLLLEQLYEEFAQTRREIDAKPE